MKYFLLSCHTLWLILSTACQRPDAPRENGYIITVNGPLVADELGFSLTHEHLMSNFGLDPNDASHYDEEALFNQVIPYLKKLNSLGVQFIFDCTTDYFGRRVDLLKAMSDSSGIHVVTNTGFYGAANDKYVPEFAFKASAEDIAKIWIDEYEHGIDDTGIKPGFIKLAFDNGAPSEIDLKLFTAGILTHQKTGLTIAVHTGNNPAAADAQLFLLEQHHVAPEAWVWIHANKIEDDEILLKAASKGAWISLDGASASNVEEYIQRIDKFKSKGMLHKILLSHDGDGYPMGGELRKFEAVLTHLIPEMLKNGYTKEEIDQLMIENSKTAFAVRKRDVVK